ncbi:MAG: hypothetical protein RL186_730, partial [Pseudomonadota bacterium]
DVSFNDMFAHSHPVTLTEGGVLHRALGQRDLMVNSVHYQGIERLGAGLQVEAQASDGVIEAFSSQQAGAPILAVQWHPEWQPKSNPDSLALFALMGRLLRGGELGVA